jgi:hypothetical protein
MSFSDRTVSWSDERIAVLGTRSFVASSCSCGVPLIEVILNTAHETAEWRAANAACRSLLIRSGHNLPDPGVPLLKKFLPSIVEGCFSPLSGFYQSLSERGVPIGAQSPEQLSALAHDCGDMFSSYPSALWLAETCHNP